MATQYRRKRCSSALEILSMRQANLKIVPGKHRIGIVLVIFFLHFLLAVSAIQSYKRQSAQFPIHRVEVILLSPEQRITGSKAHFPITFPIHELKTVPSLPHKLLAKIPLPPVLVAQETKRPISVPPSTTQVEEAAVRVDIVVSSIKMAGKIDRELRNNKEAPLDDTEVPRFVRFARAVEDAYIDRARHETRSRLELPDGTIYYSFTQGSKTKCFMTGPVTSSSGKGGGAVQITCPASFQNWSKF